MVPGAFVTNQLLRFKITTKSGIQSAIFSFVGISEASLRMKNRCAFLVKDSRSDSLL